MAQPTETPAVDLEAVDEEAQLAAARRVRRGFLPIQTNWFDRLFIAIYIGVALELLWMRLLEPNGIPLWVCHVIVIALGVLIVRKG
jgi:predicted small integral membrane protein